MAEIPMLNKMVALFVGGILAAVLIPVALLQLAQAVFVDNSTGTPVIVDPTNVVLFSVISIAVVVVVVILFFKEI